MKIGAYTLPKFSHYNSRRRLNRYVFIVMYSLLWYLLIWPNAGLGISCTPLMPMMLTVTELACRLSKEGIKDTLEARPEGFCQQTVQLVSRNAKWYLLCLFRYKVAFVLGNLGHVLDKVDFLGLPNLCLPDVFVSNVQDREDGNHGVAALR